MYWDLVDRPNLMIKIPATEAGLPAIEQAIFDGLNINVTLLFSGRGLRARDGGLHAARWSAGWRRAGRSTATRSRRSSSRAWTPRSTSASRRLGNTELQGRAGLANARAAYQAYQRVFEGERFAALREAGAPVQRPLWASTGVKNPAYPRRSTSGASSRPHTVNTMPMPTLRGRRRRGRRDRRDRGRGSRPPT